MPIQYIYKYTIYIYIYIHKYISTIYIYMPVVKNIKSFLGKAFEKISD